MIRQIKFAKENRHFLAVNYFKFWQEATSLPMNELGKLAAKLILSKTL
jgi:hypothetical protein